MVRLKTLKTFDWISLIALTGSVAFRLIGKFLASDSAGFETAYVASEVMSAAAFLWIFVRAMQSTTPPLYRNRENGTRITNGQR